MRTNHMVIAILLGLLGVSSVHGETPQTTPPKIGQVAGQVELLKVSSSLRTARTMLLAGRSEREIRDRLPSLSLVGDVVRVEVRLERGQGHSVEALRAAGMVPDSVHPDHRIVYGSVSLADLAELAAVPGVRRLKPWLRPRSRAGAVDNQADASMRADLARANLGVDGTGVTIGILSDSFSRTGTIGGTRQPSNPEMCPAPLTSTALTGATTQVSGDLPALVTLNDDCDSGSSYCSAVRDEGAAMAELIHDIAPGAALSFHSAFNSQVDFAEGIEELRACGADVIVDDTIYLDEPMFQDGLVAQAIEQVVADGAVYFTAAGNQATYGVDEGFDDLLAADEEEDDPSGIDFHDFANGGADPYAAVTVPPGCGITAVLQWNEPFDDPLGGGARTDLDLYICEGESGSPPNPPPFNPQQSSCVYFSQDAQGCGAGEPQNGAGDPLEFVDYVNHGAAPETVYLAVDHYCGDVDGDLQEDDAVSFRIVTFGLDCSLADPGYAFEAGVFDRAQIFGHAAAVSANAVAAVFFEEIDSGGTTDPPSHQIDVEPFASLGGELPFYFEGDGTPIPGGPVTRFKPELAAPDGGNTTFFGTDISSDPDGFPNFFGSSAAASNAAAVAALVLDANPDLDPGEVRWVLQNTAIDIEATGRDSLAGDGLIDAYDAVVWSVPIAAVTPQNLAWGTVGLADLATRILTLGNEALGPATLEIASMSLSDPANFSLDVQAGEDPCASPTPSLEPGDTCTLGVTFSPTTVGFYNESLTIQSNADPILVSLSGQGMEAAISLTKSASPEVVDVGGGVVTFTVEVFNQSASTDPVTLAELSDDVFGDITDAGNPEILSTSCALGQAILPGVTFRCSFEAFVDGSGPNPHIDIVSASGTDDEGAPVAASDSAIVNIVDLDLIFQDGFESGSTSAWSSSN